MKTNKITYCNIIFMVYTLCLVFGSCNAKVTAQLGIVTYSPLIFNLTFSAPCSVPNFQILLNEMVLKYQLRTNTSTPSSYYLIQANTDGAVDPADFIIEKYMLLFTQPLLAASGNLDLKSYMLRAKPLRQQDKYVLKPLAEKDSYYYYQGNISSLDKLSVAIGVLVYFLAATTVLGMNAYFFISIYCFISLQSPLFTSLDYKISYLLLFEPHQIQGGDEIAFMYISIPMFIIMFSLLLGVLSRLFLKELGKRSGFWNQMYYFFSYKFFLTCWQLMNVPLFINTVHLVQDPDHFVSIHPFIVKLYIYLSIISNVIFCYSGYLIINPQIRQSPQEWLKYVKEQGKIRHFNMFQGYHPCIQPESWWKRNYFLFLAAFRIFLMVFVGFGITYIPNLYFQILHLIFLFTVRPFRYEFFNLANISMQIFIAIFYLYKYIVTLYTQISDQVLTSSDTERILLSYIMLVSIIIFIFFCLGIYEFYERLKFFRININYFNNKQRKVGSPTQKKSKITKKIQLLADKFPKQSMFQIPGENQKSSRQKHNNSSRTKKRERRRKMTQQMQLMKNGNDETGDRMMESSYKRQERVEKKSRKSGKKKEGKQSLLHEVANFEEQGEK